MVKHTHTVLQTSQLACANVSISPGWPAALACANVSTSLGGPAAPLNTCRMLASLSEQRTETRRRREDERGGDGDGEGEED